MTSCDNAKSPLLYGISVFKVSPLLISVCSPLRVYIRLVFTAYNCRKANNLLQSTLPL